MSWSGTAGPGEAGAIGSVPAIANAMIDTLAPRYPRVPADHTRPAAVLC